MWPGALVKPDTVPFITAEYVARCHLALLESDKHMQTLRRLHMPCAKKQKQTKKTNVWQNFGVKQVNYCYPAQHTTVTPAALRKHQASI